LRQVVSYTQLLQQRYKGRLDEEADEFIGYALEGTTRMRRLIRDLLAYWRVDTQANSLEPVDCHVILNRVLDDLQATINESEAIVSHTDLPTVMADGAQLTQLFHNLIDNAIKFRSTRPPEVYIGVERKVGESLGETAYWLFFVWDNGIGIAPQYLERIFLIFQRLHTRYKYKGTGIGLAICKKIVERHGGRIWVESELGKGATFYFTIPDREEDTP
jgi:light-regulated signal transduction histidine kinase (bacteriophytochrome)